MKYGVEQKIVAEAILFKDVDENEVERDFFDCHHKNYSTRDWAKICVTKIFDEYSSLKIDNETIAMTFYPWFKNDMVVKK